MDGPMHMRAPLKSGLATSVIYTMAGLGPMAENEEILIKLNLLGLFRKNTIIFISWDYLYILLTNIDWLKYGKLYVSSSAFDLKFELTHWESRNESAQQ